MKPKQVLNVVAFVAILVVNGFAGSVGINGVTTGEVSDDIPSLFTPAGYVFSIWGLIYLGLAGYTVYQALPGQRDRAPVERMGYWFIVSSVFNVVWLVLWHYRQFALSFLAMLGLLGSLIAAYVRLDIGFGSPSTRDKLLVHLPFSVYLGWISVATIANAATVLYLWQWNGFGIAPALWTAIMVVIAAALGVIMIVRRGETAFPLVIVWAGIGIALARAGDVLITTVTWVSVAALVVVLVWRRLRTPAKPA
jgi:hypothetical protein